MIDSKAPTIICVASFFKGNDFIRECKRLGAAVVLLTREKLRDADWARESLDDLIAIPGKTSVQSYLAAATHVARQHGRVVNLLTEYARRFSQDFAAVAPPEETAEQHL